MRVERLKIKKMLAAGVAVLMVMGFAACGEDTEGDVIKTAQKELAKIKSMNYDLIVDMNMSAAGQSMESVTKGKISFISEPMTMKMDMNVDEGDQGAYQMLMYAEQSDKEYIMYMSADNGENWIKQIADDAAALQQYDAQASMELYLSSVDSFKEAGVESINGSDAVRYDGIISKEAMSEVMGASGASMQLEQYGITGDAVTAMYREMGELPVSVWIDKESTLPVKYEMDMTAVMQKMMTSLMESMGAGPGTGGLTVDKMFLSMIVSDFDKVETIVIPEEAKNAEEVSL